MVTLKDISQRTGLSVTTVSRALNGFPEVNEGTRRTVEDEARRLGYKPNRVAQRLVTGRSGMVGMIAKIRPDMSTDPTFFEILTGLTAALAEEDIDLVLSVDQNDDPIRAYERMLDRNILDGFILNAPLADDPRVAFLRARNIPFVLHGQTGRAVDYPFYGIDNRAVSVDSVVLLSGLGHQRIAFLNGDLSQAFAHDRLDGYRTALSDAGLSTPDVFIAAATPSPSYGYSEALAMLAGQRGPRPTAFVCASTLIASGVMRAAADLGLSVPDDLSVIAHDDALPTYRAVEFSPPLSVTRSPLRDACIPLARHLAAHLDGVPGPSLQTLVRAELIVRASTGPVPLEGNDPWP